jgi:hypothetical protein
MKAFIVVQRQLLLMGSKTFEVMEKLRENPFLSKQERAKCFILQQRS